MVSWANHQKQQLNKIKDLSSSSGNQSVLLSKKEQKAFSLITVTSHTQLQSLQLQLESCINRCGLFKFFFFFLMAISTKFKALQLINLLISALQKSQSLIVGDGATFERLKQAQAGEMLSLLCIPMRFTSSAWFISKRILKKVGSNGTAFAFIIFHNTMRCRTVNHCLSCVTHGIVVCYGHNSPFEDF